MYVPNATCHAAIIVANPLQKGRVDMGTGGGSSAAGAALPPPRSGFFFGGGGGGGFFLPSNPAAAPMVSRCD